MTKDESRQIESYILHHFPMTNRQFSQELGVSTEVVKYHIKKLGLVGQRQRGGKRLCEYDELIRIDYPNYSASILAEKIGIHVDTVNRIAKRIGVSHNPGFYKRPYPIKENLVGKKYGSLSVEKQLGTNKWGQMMYLCVCQCGRTTRSTAGNLKNGHTTSCGCKRKIKNND